MPPAQRKPPPAPPGGPRGDKTPLLAGRAERSDGAPSAAARKKHAGPTVVVSHEGGLDTVTFQTSNSACLATLFVVCTALAFCGGYYLREHQSTTAQRKVSAIESLLIERAEGGLLPIINATELLLMREFDDLSRIEEGTERCADGLLISGPYPSKMGTMTTLLLLLWSFLGVAVLSDAFMMAIEEITSQEVVQKIQVGQGRTRTLHTHLWNPTIANLSLMALGSSAPEILLSVIEICGNGFYAGELGPSTIVGSAAFNMLVISGVCVLAIPNGEGRLIKELCVFFITATFSILAYAWLIFILQTSSPNVVEPWEGAATFLFFPLLLALAYLADQGVLACPDCSAKKGGTGPARSRSTTVIVSEHENRGAGARSRNKSTAYYRVNATRNLTGGRSIESASEEQLSGMTVTVQEEQSEVFELSAANVLVNAEDDTAKVVVFRSGKVSSAASVEYTILSKARGAKSATSVVEFHPNQQSATILVELLEEDHALKEGGAPAFEVALRPPPPPAKLGSRSKCAVRAISSDSAGVFVLVDEELRVREEDKKAVLTVRRQDGSKGRVSCMVNTHDGTAVAPADYLAVEDLELVFEEGVVERSVEVTIINDDQYEGDETFEVEFSEASNGASFSLDCDGGPEKALATVTIIGDEPTEGCPANCTELAVRLGVNVDASRLVVVLWAQQFDEALTLDEDTGCIGLVMFLLSIPWKLGCALAPPPRLWNGWASFFVVLALIGVLTAFIGDLASNLGCCLGISKSITAITFVALGTSLPDTFASMTAAASEDTADASIGNITGSNSVNVFLGLGLPWTIAAVYWSYYGSGEEDAWRARYAAEPWYDASMPLGFAVPAGELGFSVLVFTVCALICLGTLMLRRVLLGYELGFAMQLPTAIFFVMLWLAYITACVWNSA